MKKWTEYLDENGKDFGADLTKDEYKYLCQICH